MPPIYYLSLASPLVAIWIGAKKRRGVMWWYVVSCIVFDLLISGSKRLLHTNYLIYVNPFFLIEFVLVTLAFRQIFHNRKLLLVTAAVLISAFIWNTNGLRSLDYPSVGMFYFAYIAYSILGFYRLIQTPGELPITRSPFFWLCVAFLIFGSGAFLLIVFRDYLTRQDLSLYNNLWKYAFVGLNIIKNITIAIAISQLKPTPVETRQPVVTA